MRPTLSISMIYREGEIEREKTGREDGWNLKQGISFKLEDSRSHAVRAAEWPRMIGIDGVSPACDPGGRWPGGGTKPHSAGPPRGTAWRGPNTAQLGQPAAAALRAFKKDSTQSIGWCNRSFAGRSLLCALCDGNEPIRQQINRAQTRASGVGPTTKIYGLHQRNVRAVTALPLA